VEVAGGLPNRYGPVVDWLGDFLGWWTTGRVAAVAAVAAAVAAITGAVSAVRTLRRAREDSRERSRPIVAAELRRIPYSQGSQALVIKNDGPSVARNVRVTFEPPIPVPADPSTSATPYLKRRYAGPIPALTPGMELENVYKSAIPRDSEPTPDQILVRVAYQGPDGHRYEDEFPLDTGLLEAHTYITSSAAPESMAKEALNVLKKIHGTLQQRQQRPDTSIT
jgi:hypothetical protein